MLPAKKSDNAAEYGLHVFTKAGLGDGPFKLVGVTVRKFQACQGAPMQPGGSCAYCGTGIMECFELRGSTPTAAGNQTFIVGSDCIGRAGDAGLIRAYKTHPDYRKIVAAKNAARDEANKAQWTEWMADDFAVATFTAHKIPAYTGTGDRPWLEYAVKSWEWSGASGRAKLVRAGRKILTGAE